MPIVIKCPHCRTGSHFDIACHNHKLRDPHRECAVGFCSLCKGEVWFELSPDLQTVYTSYPLYSEEVPVELPPNVKSAFKEAISCYGAGAPNGALLMCRRAIQEALDDLGARKGDLPTQLKDLADRNVITPDLKEWADHAQIGGRIAAHGKGGEHWGEPSLTWGDNRDAENVINFCKSFFEYVYVMKERNRQRRSGLSKPT